MTDLTALWVILIVCGSIIILGVFIAVVKSCAERRDGRQDRHNIMEMGYHYRGKSAQSSMMNLSFPDPRPSRGGSGGGGRKDQKYQAERIRERPLQRERG